VQRPGFLDPVGLWRLRRRLRPGRFDTVYDLQTSDRSRFDHRLMGRPAWAGIARGASLPHANPARDTRHTLDRQAEQLRDLFGRDRVALLLSHHRHPGDSWLAAETALLSRRTGVPLVLNTSFNNHAEPIVDSVEDAIVCFLTTGLDALFVGDWRVTKRGVAAAAWTGVTIALAPGLILRDVVRADGTRACEAAFPYHHGRVMTTSAKMFEVLRRSDAERRLAPSEVDELANQLVDLWTLRMVKLEPLNLRTLEP